jgi:DNA-binding NarL/FixJ family response regulator
MKEKRYYEAINKNTSGLKVSQITSVLIVDDHLLIAETIAAVLTAQKNFEVDVARDVETATQMVRQAEHYDVILLDYNVPGMDTLKGMHQLIEANGSGVTLFSGMVSFTSVERAINQGASGFIPKTLPLKVLSHAIQIIAGGETYLPTEWLLWTKKGDDAVFGFKPREMKVFTLLCEGLQNKEIAFELNITEPLVKMDVKVICRKLGVRNRTQAVIAAHKKGILEM